MLGAQLIVRLEETFGVEITLRYLFDHPTLAAMASFAQPQSAQARDDGPDGSRRVRVMSLTVPHRKR